MAYMHDNGLEFLRELESSELNDLVEVLTKGKDGNTRITESLTTNDLYKKFVPDHKEYIELIMAEIQTFGGNSIINIFRGGGVEYKEILCDVCKKMKVNYNKNSEVIVIENCLFMKILEDSIEKMTTEELKEVVEDLNLKTTSYNSQAVTMALQIAIKNGGFAPYKIAVIVANAVWKILFGKGLAFATNATITRTMSLFAGPIGWIITGLWTMFDIAGPAYRVTIPTVIQIAFLRQVYLNKSEQS